MSAPDDMPSTPKPPKWLYIIAWLIAAFVNHHASGFVDSAIADSMVSRVDDLLAYVVVSSIVTTGVGLAIWILVYAQFPSLNIAKVIPWMWGLGALGVVISLMMIERESRGLGAVPIVAVVIEIACFVAMVLLFRTYFRAKGRA